MSDSPIVINGTITKWLLGIVGSAVALGFAVLVNINTEYGNRIAQLERFQERTEANRFNDTDARELFQDMIRYHDDNTPPPEVTLQLIQLDERLDRLEGR